jgi:hypothetical protein
MILKLIFSFILCAGFTGCATGPKCGNAADSQTVFTDAKTCSVRIRQVLVVSKMDLPTGVKESELTSWRLEWIESELVNGRIRGGHYQFVPPDMAKSQ